MQLIHKEVIVPDDAEVYFVGDIHGCNDLLLKALREVKFDNSKDYLISVGDLIDRGKDNFKVLSKFLYTNSRFLSVMGNHDSFMAYHNIGHNMDCWLMNGGMWIIKDDLSKDHLESLARDIKERFPIFMTIKHRGKTFGVVHGEVPNIFRGNGRHDIEKYGDCLIRNWYDIIDDVTDYVHNSVQSDKDMNFLISPYLWGRDVIEGVQAGLEYPPVEGVDFVFHGHTGVRKPLIHQNRVYIDTGSVFNQRLTLAWMEDSKIKTVTTNPGNEESDWGELNG